MSNCIIEFDSAVQSIGALREAAYRLIGVASCRIDSEGGRYLCHLEASEAKGRSQRFLEAGELRGRFLDLVTDENLREKIASETGHVRDVILALAFGALADASTKKH